MKRLPVRAQRAVARFPIVSEQEPHQLPGTLVVSLTSYPSRFPTLVLTLKALLDQTVRADHTVLWIAREDFHLLPSAVLELQAHGLTIRQCDDLRSYKKIIPPLIAYRDAFIVTADDDLYYPPTWLAKLEAEALAHPRAIIVHRAHMAVQEDDGSFAPYDVWENDTQAQTDASNSLLLFPTGGAGALYPPQSLPPETVQSELFKELCPDADDVWLFWMAERAGTPQRRVPSKFDLIGWAGSQDVGLKHNNVYNSGNDQQIDALLRYFGPLYDRRVLNSQNQR